MDWDNIRVFLAVARNGTAVEAGRSLGLDHSTVSRRVASLEESIGATLFDRAGRRLRINDAGTKMLETARKFEAILLRDLAAIENMRADRAGTVRIGAPEGFGVGYLAARLGEFAAAYPEITLELVALPRNYSLAAREVDIAITLDRPKAGEIAVRKLTDYHLRFYGTDAYFAAFGCPVKSEDLPHHRLCGYIDQLLHTGELDYLFLNANRLSPAIRSTSIAAQMAVVASGAAIGVLPVYMACNEPGLKRVLDALLMTRSYWLAIHEDMRSVRRVALVSQLLVKSVQRDQRLFLGS